jgi:hypothetical protein
MAKSNLFKLVTCTYQVVTWNDGTKSHQYSTRKTRQCKVGKESFKFSIWRPNQSKTTDSAVLSMTFPSSMSLQEIELKVKKYGNTAYFALYDDDSQELLSASDVDSLGDSKEALLSAPLPATM